MADTATEGANGGANEPTSEPHAAGEQQAAAPHLPQEPRRYFGDDLTADKMEGLLRAFYARFNSAQLDMVERLAVEFETRVKVLPPHRPGVLLRTYLIRRSIRARGSSSESPAHSTRCLRREREQNEKNVLAGCGRESGRAGGGEGAGVPQRAAPDALLRCAHPQLFGRMVFLGGCTAGDNVRVDVLILASTKLRSSVR